MDEIVKEILETDRRRIGAMVTSQEEDLECFFTEDLTYTHTNGALDSKATLIDKIRTKRYDYAAIETKDVLVKKLASNAAVLTGAARLDIRTDTGKTVSLPIRFTSVYVQDGGAWRMTAWQSTRAE